MKGAKKRKGLYHAHAMPTYGTHSEKEELSQIRTRFPSYAIINPGTYQTNPAKRVGGMSYCFGLINGCEILVFTRYRGHITSGVGQEINYAISKGILVYELDAGNFCQIKKKVNYLSREDTVALYWRQ